MERISKKWYGHLASIWGMIISLQWWDHWKRTSVSRFILMVQLSSHRGSISNSTANFVKYYVTLILRIFNFCSCIRYKKCVRVVYWKNLDERPAKAMSNTGYFYIIFYRKMCKSIDHYRIFYRKICKALTNTGYFTERCEKTLSNAGYFTGSLYCGV